MASRSKPFSGKQKKQQLLEKRSRKKGGAEDDSQKKDARHPIKGCGGGGRGGRGGPAGGGRGGAAGRGGMPVKKPQSGVIDLDEPSSSSSKGPVVEDLTRGRKMQFVPGACTSDGFPLKTVFAREDNMDVEDRINASRLPIPNRLRSEDGPSRESGDHFYSVVIDFPHRPPWQHSWSAHELDINERKYFEGYLRNLYMRYPSNRLNYFEHNIEVWRQLWRVLEISDTLLVLADIRHPIFHFPPSLYHYVTKVLGKPMVLILNKTDLVPSEIVDEWVAYFRTTYPRLKVVAFSNYPREQGDLHLQGLDVGHKIKQGRKRYGAARGVAELLKSAGLDPDASPSDSQSHQDDGDDDDHDDDDHDEIVNDDEIVHDEDDHPASCSRGVGGRAELSYTTIGLIGHPNVGKSSIINSLKKKKVVSTSRTPGHTKHFQTIFLTPKIRLCDSPGLIFPALDMPKELQVLSGLYPIAQTREPYSAIGFLAKRVPIERVYGLRPVDAPEEAAADPDSYPWSAWDLCEAYAKKRSYTTKRGRFDVYRAGNEILRECLDGVVLLYFAPPLKAMRTEEEEAAATSVSRLHSDQSSE